MDASAGEWTRRQEQGDEVDFEALKLIKTNHDVNVKVADGVDLNGLPGECNLMAVSNTWGILVVGGNHDFRIHRLDDVHRLLEESLRDASPKAEPTTIVKLPARPVWIRLASDDRVLVVCTINSPSIMLYRLQDLMTGHADPYQTLSNGVPGHILDLLPNPAPTSESDTLARNVAILSADGLFSLDLESGLLKQLVWGQLTSASWSRRGKQMVCGHRSGKLVQYNPEGIAKGEVLPPPEIQEGFYPTSVEWIGNDDFLVSYKNSNADEDEPLAVFTIHRNKASSETVYHEFFDPLNTMGLSSRPASFRFTMTLRQWGDETRHLSFLLSGRSSEIGVMRMKSAQESQAPIWETLMLEETARGIMPAGKGGDSEDSSCIGLELDLTGNKPIVMGIVGGVEVPDLPPAPRLLAYTQEGTLVSFDLRYQEAGPYPYMVKPQEIGAAPKLVPAGVTQTPTTAPISTEKPSQTEQKPAFGGFGSQSSGFGASAFGNAPTSSNSATGAHQSAFGQPSKGFGQSAFGQSSNVASGNKNAFGQSSSPAFGSSGFGQKPSEVSPSTPAPTKPSPLGQPSSSPAFGQSAFGSNPSSSAFGQTTFGQKPTSAPTAFGQSAFGGGQTPKTPSAFGSQATASASQGSAPGTSAAAFGQPAFGQKAAQSSDKPAFGQSSAPSAFGQSAFGQPSKPSAFGQPSSATPSAFAAASSPSTGGFAGFGQKPGGQSGFGFGQSAFGQNKPSAPSTSSPSLFGSGGASSSGSAFGSSTAFGASAFGSKSTSSGSAFGTTPQPEQKASTPTPSGFGLGGLGSALENTASDTAESSSPPDSPVGPAKEDVRNDATKSQTPPESPVFGASKSLSSHNDDDDDDDSPPPTPKPAVQTPAKTPQTTSAFIKPATAFGSTSSFGSFTQRPSKPAPTTTPSATPNAFSKPISTTPAASAFGSPSFGSSAFGQSSTPSAISAFGRPAAPPPAVGNITGGFGGFAAKKSETSSAFSGFGGTPSKSAFGMTGTGSSFSALLSGDKAKAQEVPPASQTPEIKQEPLSPPAAQSQSDSTPIAAEISKSPASPQVKQEIQSPEPQGYVVPAIPGTAEREDTSEPEAGSQEASAADEESPRAKSDQGDHEDQEDGHQAEQEGVSSPELIDHAEAQSETDDNVDHEEADDVEDKNDYDDEEQEEGEQEYSEGEYDDEDEYEDEEEEDGEDGAELEEAEEEAEIASSPEADSPTPADATAETSSSETPSLFSRLAPPPSRPSYQGKHAVRTSSPLGSQPPENAETATPPGTPPQPPAQVVSKDASNAAPPPFFGFNTDAAKDVSKAPSSSRAPSTSSPSLFGQTQSASSPALGLGKPPSQQAEQRPGFSFGLGKPSTLPQQAVPTEKESEKKPAFGLGSTAQAAGPTPVGSTNKLPFSFGKPATASAPPAATPVKPVSLFGQSQPRQTPTSAASPIRPVQPATPSAALTTDTGKFATPARTPVKDSPQAKDDGSRQMAAVMARMVSDLMSEVEALREALATHAEYHRGLEPKFNKVTVDDLDAHSDLPFSSLSDITQVIDQLTADMSQVTQSDQRMERRVLELQSKLVKTDMKMKQAERLVESHDDDSLSYQANSQDLGTSQQEERSSMRRRLASAESRLDDLERSIDRLKRSVAEGQPTVDKLHRFIDEVEAAIVDKQDLIEDLSMRVKSIRLSTPSSRRSIGYKTSSRHTQDSRGKALQDDLPPDVVADVQRRMDQQDKKLGFTSKTAPVTRVSRSSATVQAGQLSLPGKLDISQFIRDDEQPEISQPKPEEDLKIHPSDQRPAPGFSSSATPVSVKVGGAAASTSTPSQSVPSLPPAFNLTPGPAASSPSPAFGGIKLSLDPGDLSSSHSRSRTAVAGSRAHHAAPRLNASPSASDKSSAGTSPAVSFFPPPNGGQAAASPSTKHSPKGFFSFSGFGQP